MGAVFALFAGFYYWAGKIVGKQYNEILGQIHFWIMFIGVTWIGKIFGLYLFQWFNNIDCFAQSGYLFALQSSYKYIFFSNTLFLSRSLSTLVETSDSNKVEQKWVLYFKNIESSKREIYKQLKGKSGVYMFINNIAMDKPEVYVGSSITLARRMSAHFFYATSTKSNVNSNLVLYKAMKKYKLENFSLVILEFCKSDLKECAELEQKWIDFYQPKYYILKIARSSLGLKHSMDTILCACARLKELFRKENHPKYGTEHSIETKEAISLSLAQIKEFYKNNPHLACANKGKKGKLSPQYGIGGTFVFCYKIGNNNIANANEELIFPSINAARQHFKVRWTTIKKIIDTSDSLAPINFNNEKWIVQSVPLALQGQRYKNNK